MAKKLTQEQFVEKANIRHNFKFDYSKSEYINSYTKVVIICPIHGNFLQIPNSHLRGDRCFKCHIDSLKKKLSLTTEEFINKANSVHNFLYDYSKVDYKGTEEKIIVICKIHGEFMVSPHHHLSSKTTCQKCGRARTGITHTHSLEQFLEKAKDKHGHRYSYENVIYKGTEIKVSITCNIHGTFYQSPHSHLNGAGCNKCTRGGAWRKTEWIEVCNKKSCTPLVYIIRCFNGTEEFIKIGRTKNSTKFRFRHKSIIPYSYEIIKEIHGSPDFIYDKETELHRLYKNLKYKPSISFAGETECFNISILSDFK